MKPTPHIKQQHYTTLHNRTPHSQGYDLELLCQQTPALARWLITTPAGKQSIDFHRPEAVKTLNQALLRTHYQLQWSLASGYLCPPVPGRADYLHRIADIMAESNHGQVPSGSQVKVLDIGCGANCIYPLLGNRSYQWQFIGSDIDAQALQHARQLIHDNQLQAVIQLRQQQHPKHSFNGIIKPGDIIDFTLCNPPFHRSQQQAEQGSRRKWRNLKRHSDKSPAFQLNFAGQSHELYCEGGEPGFVVAMIRESQRWSQQVSWFSTLLSKHTTLPVAERQLNKLPIQQLRIIHLQHGNKTSRLLCWSFMSQSQLSQRAKRWK